MVLSVLVICWLFISDKIVFQTATSAINSLPSAAYLQQTQKDLSERRKSAVQNEFTRNFGSLQQTAFALKREHEEQTLDARGLSRNLKIINKNARALRTVMILGDLPKPVVESKKPLMTISEFDQAIQRLTKLIYDFAHNPIHKNRRVFNADEAARARTDLENIIVLSRKIEDCAKDYRAR
jgi:hypothetical protein